jgi:hypothetical protein
MKTHRERDIGFYRTGEWDDPRDIEDKKNVYNYHNSGNYSSFCLLFKTQLNSIGLLQWNLTL